MSQRYISRCDIIDAVRFDGKNVDDVQELKWDSDYGILPDGSLGIDVGTPEELVVQPDEIIYYDKHEKSWKTMPEHEFRRYYFPVAFEEARDQLLVRDYYDVGVAFTAIVEHMKAACLEETKEATAYPFWAILYTETNEWHTGPYFSRSAAEEYRRSLRLETQQKTHVYCLSGKYSSVFEKLLDLAASMIPEGDPK